MFHPLLVATARRHAAAEYSATNGVGFFAALRKVRDIDGEDFDACCLQAEAVAAVKIPQVTYGSSIGDGHIIQAIIDWLKSPEGQAFIAALIKIILGALMMVA